MQRTIANWLKRRYLPCKQKSVYTEENQPLLVYTDQDIHSYARSLMNLREQIDSHEYLYLWEIGEPEVNVLRVVVDEAKASDHADVEIPDTPFMGNPIISDETCRRYEITFPSYVAYAVLNESFAKVDDYEQYTGRYFRIYSKSHFMDYLGVATFASDDYPGKSTHYEIACLDHIVEVVSAEEPEIRELSRA